MKNPTPANENIAMALLILIPTISFKMPKIGAAAPAMSTAMKFDLQKAWFLSITSAVA